jgi:hypothetical protein
LVPTGWKLVVGLRKLRIEESDYLCFLPDMTRVFQLRRFRWAAYLEAWEEREIYRGFLRTTLMEMTHIEYIHINWRIILKLILREIGWVSVDLISMTQDSIP